MKRLGNSRCLPCCSEMLLRSALLCRRGIVARKGIVALLIDICLFISGGWTEALCQLRHTWLRGAEVRL